MSYDIAGAIQLEQQQVSLVPCHTCGRNFNKKALDRHAPICQKNQAKKPPKLGAMARKSQQKVAEIAAKQQNSAPGSLPGKKANIQITSSKATGDWRSKREDMIATMKYARQADRAAKLGGPMPDAPVLQNDPYADYVKCNYCDRKFAEESSKRHIEFCKMQSSRRPSVKPGVQAAAAKQNKRVLYQPPKLKKKTSVGGSASPKVSSPSMARRSTGAVNERNAVNDRNPNRATAASSSKYGIKSSLQKHETTKPPPVRFSKPTQALPSNCRSCSIEYPVDWAKFCPNCGQKR